VVLDFLEILKRACGNYHGGEEKNLIKVLFISRRQKIREKRGLKVTKRRG